jgi:hypothetical protein
MKMLPFLVGKQIDEGFWTGSCHGRTGLFLASYVELQQ